MRRPALIRDCSGAGAAEFALVMPLMLVFLFGIIDAGRYMWLINRSEKAVQMGVRMAVVTDHLSAKVAEDFLGQCSTPLTQGDPIPANCYQTQTCNQTGCSPDGSAANYATNFGRIAGQMRLFMPDIANSNVEVIYSPSGLGYAGDPNGPDMAPLVTVRLSGLTIRPIATFGTLTLPLPEVRSSLTFEDGAGTVAN